MTRAWEVLDGGRVLAGIPVDDDGTVHVGQAGRGRELRRVAVPASLVRDGRLYELPGDGRALLLLRDQSGYRGGWRVGDLCPGAPPEPSGDGLWIYHSACALCGHDRPDAARYQHAPDPVPHRIWDHDRPGGALHDDGVRVLAEGWRAQGDAGRMGGGSEYLLTAPVGWVAYLWREGRLYGGAPVLRVTVEPDGSASCADLRHDPAPLGETP